MESRGWTHREEVVAGASINPRAKERKIVVGKYGAVDPRYNVTTPG